MMSEAKMAVGGRRSKLAAEAWETIEQAPMSIAPGEVFRSPSKTLTDAHFLLFAAISSDNHPIHYDIEYVKKTRFSKPVAHGLLVASLTALGASSISGQLEGFVLVEQGCRFLSPAMAGDTLSPRFKLEKIWTESGKQFARFNTAIINQGGEVILEGFQIYRIVVHDNTACSTE